MGRALVIMLTLWLGVDCAKAAAERPNDEALERARAESRGSGSSTDGDQVRGRLRAAAEKLGEVRDFRAEFEERKHSPLLRKPMISRGAVRSAGGRMRWDTTEPHRSVLTVDAEVAQIYYPDRKAAEVYPLAEYFRSAAVSPVPEVEHLEQHFEISPGKNEPEGTIAVTLRPKAEELRRHVPRIDVIIDEATGLVSKAVLAGRDDESTEILFGKVEVNSGISKEDVTFALPAGTEVSRFESWGSEEVGRGRGDG